MTTATILADNGVSSGSSGLKTSGGNDGTLVLQTTTSGGTATTAVTIDTSQNTTLAGYLNAPNTFGFKNRIINGGMVVSQYNGTSSVTPSTSAYVIDRFALAMSVGSKLTAQQNPSSTETGYAGRIAAGFSKYLGVTTASAYSVGSGDYFGVQHKIEGYNIADLQWGTSSAKTVTLSFLVYSSLTGTFGGSLKNSTNDSCYPFTYTISAANTWTQITLTIAGPTSGAAWDSTNGAGVQITWALGVGSTYSSSTSGSWVSTNYWSVTGAVSVVGTAGATFYVTGVQLEKGTQATSFDFRSYGTELALCQRYAYVFSGYTLGYTYSSSDGYAATMRFPTTMRAAPSLISGTFTPNTGNAGTVAIINPTQDSIRFYNSANNWTSNTPFTISCTLSAEL